MNTTQVAGIHEHTDLRELELRVDRYGLHGVLRALAQIASDKGEHVRSNWQDKTTAKAWDKAMMHIDRAQNACEKLGV